MRSAPGAGMRAAPAVLPLFGCWLLAASVWAGEARLLEGANPDRVVIEASDANVDEVLGLLARHFEFAVERSVPPGQPVRMSGRLEGSLDELLERLLRHEGHMIVRSAEARSGISRVLLIEAKAGAVPVPSLAGPIAAIKAKIQAREREERGQ